MVGLLLGGCHVSIEAQKGQIAVYPTYKWIYVRFYTFLLLLFFLLMHLPNKEMKFIIPIFKPKTKIFVLHKPLDSKH